MKVGIYIQYESKKGTKVTLLGSYVEVIQCYLLPHYLSVTSELPTSNRSVRVYIQQSLSYYDKLHSLPIYVPMHAEFCEYVVLR